MGRGGTRGGACALLRVWRGGCAHRTRNIGPARCPGASPPSSRYRPKVGRSWCSRATDALRAPIPPPPPRGGRAAARHDVAIDLGSFGGVQLAETSWRCYRACAALHAVAGSGGQCGGAGVVRGAADARIAYEISSALDVPPTGRKLPPNVRRLDVASPVANDRAQHARRATHTRRTTHTERRPARAHFALAPRRAGRHFRGGCAAQGRRSCCSLRHRTAALWSTTRTTNERFAHQLHGF